MTEPYVRQYVDDMPKPEPVPAPPAYTLTMMKVAFAVFLGNLMTGLLAAALYYGSK